MKNILKTSLWLLMAVALTTGCSDEQEVLSNTKLKDVVITAEAEGHSPNARTQVGDIGNNGSLIMMWNASDKIGVFTSTTNNALFQSTNTGASNKAAFRGSLPETETPQKAYYPYAEGVNDLSAIPVVIPDTQVFTDVNSMAAYDYKAASQCYQLNDGTYKMNFRQMATMIRLKINLSNADGTSLSSDERLESIGMSGEIGLSGNLTYDLNNLDAGLSDFGADINTYVTVEMAKKPLLSEKVTAYVAILPGATKGDIIDFTITTNKHVVKFSTELLDDLRAGVFYDLPLNGTVLSNNKAVVEEVVAPEPVTEETANCYMINTIGNHDFCATQIGNGDKGIIPGAGFHVTSSKINPQSAKLIWQDVENFIDASSVRIQNGRVHYKANKNSGNAMIAVYDNVDSSKGKILWSWHIWGVGDEMPTDDEVTNRAGAKFLVMNRTLGTHSAMSQNTTLYQWGRKDPFPNSNTYYLADGSAVDISTTYPVYNPESVNDLTLLASVQNCDKMMNANKATGEWAWLPEDNQYLWGDTNIDDQYTWSSEGKLTNRGAGAGWTHGKTIYDPSPVGYRVANRFTFTGFAKLDNGVVNISGGMNKGQIETTANILVEYTIQGKDIERYHPKFVDGVFVGYFFKNNDTDMAASFYPMTGYRFPNDGGSVSDVGINAGYYVSSPQKNAGAATYFSISQYEYKDTDIVGGSAGNRINYNTMNFCDKWNARAIRCVRE